MMSSKKRRGKVSASAVSTAKEPGVFQGWILIATTWLSVMAAIVVSPILPKMTAHFSSVAHVDLMISLTATLPAFFVAFLAIPAGALADRIGRKKMLFLAVLVYGLVGTAPVLMDSLQKIVFSRAFVGITEAVIMTVGTAMIGDYYSGKRRERFLAAQTGTAPIIATVVTYLGGTMGNANWRYPFYIYTFAFLLIPLVGLFLQEPESVSPPNADTAKRALRAGPSEDGGFFQDRKSVV